MGTQQGVDASVTLVTSQRASVQAFRKEEQVATSKRWTLLILGRKTVYRDAVIVGKHR